MISNRKILLYIFIIIVNAIYAKTLLAQSHYVNPNQLTRILFLLDGSQSMNNAWDRSSRMDEAKRILINLADSVADLPNVELAFRIYGHQYEQNLANCNDTRLEVNFAKNNAKIIKKKLELLQPKGITPIALSLQKCAHDFPKGESRNIVILITDGSESCGGDPCAIAKDLQAKGIILKPFIIGLGIESSISSDLECLGQYKNAPDAASFENELMKIVNVVLTRTTAEVDLLDINEKPTETGVNITFYDTQMATVKYEMYHTLNIRGNPDTLQLDPITKYNIDVHTIPPLEKNNIVLQTNSHNKIVFNAAQGSLKIASPSKQLIKCLVRKKATQNTLHVQSLNSTEKYLTGLYDLEFITLPRIKMNNIEINQSKITSIQIAPPGTITVNKNGEVYGGIFYLNNNVWEKLYELKLKIYTESILLQPGNYRIIYRNKEKKKMRQTQIKDVTIKSNQTTTLTL